MPVIILALKSVVGLILIWLFVFFLWKDYCLDIFREDVFSIRDELFLYAADGNVSFEDSAYTILRDRLNVGLRYAHEFTLLRFVLAITILSDVPSPETVVWEKALTHLPSNVQESLIKYQNTFVLAFLKYVTLRSFFLYIALLLVTAFGVFKQAAKRYVFPKAVVGVERLESEALEEEMRNQSSLPVGVA